MAKVASFFILALLYMWLSVSFAARPEPAFHAATTLMKTHQQDGGFEAAQEGGELEEKCGGGIGEEECLMRRSLADAHLDYIYTQSHNP